MRSCTFTLSAILAAAAVVFVSAETNCNPSYNVPTSGECFTSCNVKAGDKFLPNGFTMDPTSPYFLDSLQLMCNKGTSEYTAFMTQAGMCMTGCKDDPMLFADEFAAACSWYAEHKGDNCASSNSTVDSGTTGTASPENFESGTSTSTIADANETQTATTKESAATTEPASTATANEDSNLAAGTSAANKLEHGGYALALVAGIVYFIV